MREVAPSLLSRNAGQRREAFRATPPRRLPRWRYLPPFQVLKTRLPSPRGWLVRVSRTKKIGQRGCRGGAARMGPGDGGEGVIGYFWESHQNAFWPGVIPGTSSRRSLPGGYLFPYNGAPMRVPGPKPTLDSWQSRGAPRTPGSVWLVARGPGEGPLGNSRGAT